MRRSFLSLPSILSRLVLAVLMFSAAFASAAAESTANAIFLVASRGLSDPNFRETVVLVTHPPRGGPWGVIINWPLEHRLSEVMTDYETLKGRKDVLFFGGPVTREGLVFLVRSPNAPPGATAVLREVFFTADTDLIDSLLRRPDPTRGLRVFAGHSGWAPGQLQQEIARGGWYVLPADADTIFEKDPALLWPELIQRATTKKALRDEGGGRRDDKTALHAARNPRHLSPITYHAFAGGGASQ